jgi:D-alanine-D-alanine ligase
MKILIVFGGPSREHEISVETAKQVLLNLNSQKYFSGLLYIDRNLRSSFLHSFEEYKPGLVGKSDFFDCLKDVKKYNICFLCLHGEFGEDGTIQSIFECKNINYTGSDSYSSRLCMDKYRSILIIKNLKGVRVPSTFLLNGNKIPDKIPMPCVLKPNKAGSSVGVSIINNYRELKSFSSNYQEEYLLQEYIHGLEISCPVLQKKDGSFIKLPPIEIKPKLSSFFDYKSKYTLGGSTETAPPTSISPSYSSEISDIACKIHSILGCSVYSRSDFIIKSKHIYYLETNTLPGMTSTSLVPKSAMAGGMVFSELLDFIVVNS